jgi:hypothetical protein
LSDQSSEVLLYIDKVRLVEGCDGVFQHLGADEVAHRAGLFEMWQSGAEDSKGQRARARVSYPDAGLGEHEDGLEDGGCAENESPHGRRLVALGIAALGFWGSSLVLLVARMMAEVMESGKRIYLFVVGRGGRRRGRRQSR